MNTNTILITLALVLAILVGAWFFFTSSQEATAPVGEDIPATSTPNGDINGGAGETITVNLYYYNPAEDMDQTGNIQCSRSGLVAVEREIPLTQTPIQDTINLLLEGEITASEEAQGIETEYPLPGFELEGANLADGMLTLGFNDPQNQTSGGSCRAGILWFQIEQTALQFPQVDQVEFQPETLFQP